MYRLWEAALRLGVISVQVYEAKGGSYENQPDSKNEAKKGAPEPKDKAKKAASKKTGQVEPALPA